MGFLTSILSIAYIHLSKRHITITMVLPRSILTVIMPYFLLLFDVQKCKGYIAFLMNETKCVILHIQAYNSFARLSLWIFTSISKEFIHLARGRMYIVFLFSRRFVTLLWNNAIGRFIIVAAFKGKGKYFIAQRLFITASFMERILISWIQH